MGFHLLPYAVLKETLLYLSLNYLIVTGLLAPEIMFHFIHRLLCMTILYLCPNCRCILILVVLCRRKAPFINLLINVFFDISANHGSVINVFCAVRPHAYRCITNTRIVYFCKEFYNAISMWLK